MDCRSFRNDLEEYLQGGLDFAGRFGMERHAGQCYVCKRSLDEAGQIGRMARELARVHAPADFEAQLLARIHARETGRFRSLVDRIRMAWDFRRAELSWRVLAAASLPALALAAGVVVWRTAPQPLDAPAPVDQERLARPVEETGATPRTTLPEISSTPPVQTAAVDLSSSGIERGRRPMRAAGARSSTRPPLAADRLPTLQPAESDYLEYRVPGERDFILRLPTTIRMRYAQPSEDHFIRNVSH